MNREAPTVAKPQPVLPDTVPTPPARPRERPLDLEPGVPEPTTAAEWRTRGDDQVRAKEFEASIHSYGQSLKLDPQDLLARFNRAVSLILTGRKPEAESELTKVLEGDPRFYDAYMQRGLVRMDLGRPLEAREDFTAYIHANPREPEGLLRRGQVLGGLGLRQAAIEDLTQALELHPTYAAAFTARAIVYADAAWFQHAVDDFTRAAALIPPGTPGFEEAQQNLKNAVEDLAKLTRAAELMKEGNALTGSGRHKAAIQRFTLALKERPEHALAHYNRGTAYASLGQLKRALQDFDRAVQLNPANSDAWFNRGMALSKTQKYQAAIESYTKVIEFEPENAFAYQARGRELGVIGRFADAKSDTQKALSLHADPNSLASKEARATLKQLEAFIRKHGPRAR